MPQLFFTVSDILSQVVGGVGHCHGLLRLSSSVAALPGIVIFRSRHTSNPGTLGSCNGFEHTYKYFKNSDSLCLSFARKAEKHPKHSKWFQLNDNQVNTRQTKYKYKEVLAKHDRFERSPLSFLTGMLNDHYKK